MVISHFVQIEIIGTYARELQNFSSIISTVALGFGPFALIRQHLPRSQRGNLYSVILLIGMVLMPVLYFTTGSTVSDAYNFIYLSFVVPLDAAIYCLVAFAIIAGCFRAFRVKNIDSFLVLVSAVVLMLGKVPIGKFMQPYAEWLMAVPNTAGYRGVQLGIALGLCAFTLRILLGVERTWLAEAGEE